MIALLGGECLICQCPCSFYLLNKNKMLSPQEVAEKIVEMILDDKNYQNGESVDIDK